MSDTTERAFLLDIEGTTTPISFVHDVLFPYAKSHLHAYLEQFSNSPDLLADVQQLKEEHQAELHAPPLIEPYLHWLIEQDRKSPALKSIQGKIWKRGYDDGSLRAPIFSDVSRAMDRWQVHSKLVNIFSSGSVLAQKLLFAHTDAGDLTGLIANYFDTGVGKKTDSDSYRTIAARLSVAPEEIHFISDVKLELDAAADAGMKTSLCVRPGNPPQATDSQHQVITTFDTL